MYIFPLLSFVIFSISVKDILIGFLKNVCITIRRLSTSICHLLDHKYTRNPIDAKAVANHIWPIVTVSFPVNMKNKKTQNRNNPNTNMVKYVYFSTAGILTIYFVLLSFLCVFFVSRYDMMFKNNISRTAKSYMPLFLLKHCSFFFLLFLSMQKQRSWKFSPSIPFFSHRHDTGRTACSIHSLTASLAAQHRRLSSASHARRALLSDFVIVCQRSRPLGTRERSSRYHDRANRND